LFQITPLVVVVIRTADVGVVEENLLVAVQIDATAVCIAEWEEGEFGHLRVLRGIRLEFRMSRD